MIHRYIIEATDEIKGFEEDIERLDREWGIEELEPCEDTISRQAVKRLYYKDGYIDFRKICELQSVTSQPKIGYWIDDGFYAEGHSEHAYRCSECDEHYIGYVGEYKYCPNCGAKMEGEE